jgi:hypothetical protein
LRIDSRELNLDIALKKIKHENRTLSKWIVRHEQEELVPPA